MGKDWWESVVILTTKDDSLNHADIDFLESVLIDKAFSLEKLDCDNKQKGNPPKVDKFRKVYLGQYLDEALFLMQLIGINVFSESKQTKKSSVKPASPSIINTIDTKTKLAIGKRAKAEAVKYITDQGIVLAKAVSYAVRQAGKSHCWANPQVSLLDDDWSFILNDTQSCEMIVLHIPKGSLVLQTNSKLGLRVRKDKPDLIDIKIDLESLVDTVSKIDFSKYVKTRIKY